jgi:hypothetical protein
VAQSQIFEGEFQLSQMHAECDQAFQTAITEHFDNGAIVGYDSTQPRGSYDLDTLMEV